MERCGHSMRSVVGISLPRGTASPLVGSQELEGAATAKVVWVTLPPHLYHTFSHRRFRWWDNPHEVSGGDFTASWDGLAIGGLAGTCRCDHSEGSVGISPPRLSRI